MRILPLLAAGPLLAGSPGAGARQRAEGAPAPLVSAAPVDSHLEEARSLERERRFAEARQSFERAREAASGEATKARLAGLAADAQRQEWFLGFLGEAAASDRERMKGVDLGTEVPGDPVGGDCEGLRVAGPAGETRIGWKELPAAGLARLFARTRPGPRDELNAAVFFLRSGLEREAERAIAVALAHAAELKGEVDGILARAREIEVPEGGFVRFRDRWVSPAEKEAVLLLERIERLFDRLDAAEGKSREGIVAEIRNLPEEARDPLVGALHRRREKLVERVAASPATKRLAGLREERLELDRRRAYALALIFDEQTYFHPFQPPECPPDKAALYPAVQREVDHRVAAVREALAASTRVPIGKARKALREWHEVERWIVEAAGKPAEPPEGPEGIRDWAGVDPEAEEATASNFALDAREREEGLALDARVLAFNTAAHVRYGLALEERRLVDETNAYRLLLGRRAVAVNAKVVRAARGHSMEMADRGFFSHFSETPGRRTPFDRMKLEGYEHGASENIARTGGADSAIEAWKHSAGHHRNLLGPAHREIGAGAAGGLYTLNFGTGDEFLREPDWK